MRLGWYLFEEYGDEMWVEPSRRIVFWRWQRREEPEKVHEEPRLPKNVTPYQKREYQLAQLAHEFNVNHVWLTSTPLLIPGDLSELVPGKTIQVRRRNATKPKELHNDFKPPS